MNVQSTFLFLADLLLRGAVLLPLLLLAERSLRRSPPAARSALLLCGIAALALLPITRLVPPYWTWAAAPTLTAPTEQNAALPVVKVTGQQSFQFGSLSSSPRASTSRPDWRLVSSCLWAIGVFAHLARIAHGRWQLRRL